MSHLDEGTLHALLDGELGSTELMEIEAHLAGCSACSTRLRTAREFLGEADRLVGSVQFGNYGTAASASASHRPTAKPEPAAPAAPPPPPPPPREHHPWDDGSPVLLIPDNPESSPLMRRWPKIIGWAAMIALAVSGGILVNNVAKETPASVPTSSDAGSTLASGTESDVPSNASPSERRDSGAPALTDTKTPSPPPAAVAAAKPAKSTPVKPAPPKPAPAEPAAVERKPLAGNLAAKVARPRAKDEDTAGTADAAGTADTADAAEEAATKSAEQDAIRIQAAEALTQLDRERRLNRAAAATAALDQQAAARRAATPAAPAPPPPTPEQRAQVYLRIGLDEASRQLGAPVHVIEGLNPLFMGLAPGRVAAGADTTRPVVRVVYQDAQGRMIVLDQQRARPGQAAVPAGAGAWSLGDLTMGLHGEVPPEVLRSLRSRVR
jgi:hypothetical protein